MNDMSLLPRPPATAATVADRFGRIKRKLRVSLTDRCNFRCPYCMPTDPQFMDRAERLSRVELQRLLRVFVGDLGISHLRLTGGEPLLRRDLEDLIADCGSLRALGLERISLTSNGALLAGRAVSLRRAGLDDLNVSLDALHPATFARLSGGREVGEVLDGIRAARDAGLPLKLNAVIMRDINEDEILPLARFALHEQLPLRFIEFMPLDGRGAWSQARVVPEKEILARLSSEFTLHAEPRGHDPAAYYRIDDDKAIGVIATVSNPFCASCDRLRITADGTLYTCLFAKRGTPLRAPLRAGISDTELVQQIRTAVWHKDAGYVAHPGYVERPIAMNSLGG